MAISEDQSTALLKSDLPNSSVSLKIKQAFRCQSFSSAWKHNEFSFSLHLLEEYGLTKKADTFTWICQKTVLQNHTNILLHKNYMCPFCDSEAERPSPKKDHSEIFKAIFTMKLCVCVSMHQNHRLIERFGLEGTFQQP